MSTEQSYRDMQVEAKAAGLKSHSISKDDLAASLVAHRRAKIAAAPREQHPDDVGAAGPAPRSPSQTVTIDGGIPRREGRTDPRATTGREARIPMGSQRQKLQWSVRPGYHRHWFNNVGTRLLQASQAGYTPVKETEEGHDVEVKRIVGKNENGSPRYAHLMEIREEFYKEDQISKAAEIDAVEETILGKEPPPGVEHEKGKYYEPTEGSSIRSTAG